MENEIDYCKECGTWLEPEFDTWNDREVINILGIKEVIEGFGTKECRVCETINTYIEGVAK